ncbi:MAG TPA: CAP domain-containing protein [Solirubrobacterales bacterium]|jgi:uncharacterized protein YkwD
MPTRIATLVAVALLLLPAAAGARRANAIAPASACPHQTELGAPAGVQLRAMLCMTNFARRADGLPPLTRSRPLARAAARKSADILRCDEFSHEACGREFTYWMSRFGYTRGCWSAGEDIAYGTGDLGTVRSIFIDWMNSPGHRANILGKFRKIGIGRRVGSIERAQGAVVWTQDFGSHGC